jgi:hypothetical protein
MQYCSCQSDLYDKVIELVNNYRKKPKIIKFELVFAKIFGNPLEYLKGTHLPAYIQLHSLSVQSDQSANQVAIKLSENTNNQAKSNNNDSSANQSNLWL